jgi:hypothetical protein
VTWGKYRDDSFGLVVLPLPSGLTNIVAIAAGENHDLVLKRDGTVVTWGWNGWNQTNLPPGLTNIAAIGAGGDDNLAVTTNGTVICWGRDNFSQAPAPPSLTNAQAVCGGTDHNLALRKNGTVTAWGRNQSSQTTVPPGLTNVIAIAAGLEVSLALVAVPSISPVLAAYNPAYASGTFSVSVPTTSGKSYRLEYIDSLTDTNWTPLGSTSGDGTAKILTDPSATTTHRFYRVRQL